MHRPKLSIWGAVFAMGLVAAATASAVAMSGDLDPNPVCPKGKTWNSDARGCR